MKRVIQSSFYLCLRLILGWGFLDLGFISKWQVTYRVLPVHWLNKTWLCFRPFSCLSCWLHLLGQQAEDKPLVMGPFSLHKQGCPHPACRLEGSMACALHRTRPGHCLGDASPWLPNLHQRNEWRKRPCGLSSSVSELMFCSFWVYLDILIVCGCRIHFIKV